MSVAIEYAALESPEIASVPRDSVEIPFAELHCAELGSSGVDFVKLFGFLGIESEKSSPSNSSPLNSSEIESLNSSPPKSAP